MKRYSVFTAFLLLVFVFTLLPGALSARYVKTLSGGSFHVTVSAAGVTTRETLEDAIRNSGEAPVVIGGGTWAYGSDVNINTAEYKFGVMTAYVYAEEITINGGEFTNGLRIDQATVYINDGNFAISEFCGEESNIIINGGTWTADEMTFSGDTKAPTVTIYGGTFKWDPTPYLAEDHEAIQNADGTWTVQAGCLHPDASWEILLETHKTTCPTCGKALNLAHKYVDGVCSVCGLTEVPVYTAPTVTDGETLTPVSTVSGEGFTFYDAATNEYGAILLDGIPTGLGLTNHTSDRQNLLRFFAGVKDDQGLPRDLDFTLSNLAGPGEGGYFFDIYRTHTALTEKQITLQTQRMYRTDDDMVAVIVSVVHTDADGNMTLEHMYFTGSGTENTVTVTISDEAKTKLNDPNTVTFFTLISPNYSGSPSDT